MTTKPTLLLDVDGVLADFTGRTLDIVHEVTGRRYEPKQITTWEIFDSIPESIEVRRAVYTKLKSKYGCGSIPPLPGAIVGVHELKKLAHIVVVTSPFRPSDTWMSEREEWLEEHFGIEGKDIVHTMHKQRVHGDFLVDDHPDHITKWLDYWVRSGRDPGCKAVLWSSERTISQEPDPLACRVFAWEELHRLVFDRRS